MILLASTAEKKANYKDRFKDWVVGVAIMFLFPYVMKTIVELNDALLKQIGQETAGYLHRDDGAPGDLATTTYAKAYEWYGEDEFQEHMGNAGGGIMLLTRTAALGKTGASSKCSPALGIVYLILIGQLIAILIMYYKRAFMIGFLITIFPLVGMSYVIGKPSGNDACGQNAAGTRVIALGYSCL